VKYWDAMVNFFVGCTPVTEGCAQCWGEREEDGRFRHLGRCLTCAELTGAQSGPPAVLDDKGAPYFWRGPSRQWKGEWEKPLHWKKPRVIAAGFRTDLFHEAISAVDLMRVLKIIGDTDRHIFVVTTKRPERMLKVMLGLGQNIFGNLWLGVSAHDQATVDAACDVLLQLAQGGWHTWLSLEPCLGSVSLLNMLGRPLEQATVAEQRTVDDVFGERFYNPRTSLNAQMALAMQKERLGGVIVGGESGKNARPMNPEWVRKIRDDCAAAGVPFTLKQWGDNTEAVRRLEDARFTVGGLPILAGRTHWQLPWAKEETR